MIVCALLSLKLRGENILLMAYMSKLPALQATPLLTTAVITDLELQFVIRPNWLFGQYGFCDQPGTAHRYHYVEGDGRSKGARVEEQFGKGRFDTLTAWIEHIKEAGLPAEIYHFKAAGRANRSRPPLSGG